MELIRAIYLFVINMTSRFFLFVVRVLFFIGMLASVLVIFLAIVMVASGNASIEEAGKVLVGAIVCGVSLMVLNKLFLDEV